MKMYYLLILSIFCLGDVQAQIQKPVKWKVYSKRVAENMFDIYINAEIQKPWHIYSRNSDNQITYPTNIVFLNNPLLSLIDHIKELGNLEKKIEDGATITYYHDNVSYVQRVKVKSKIKINITGSIEFMACNRNFCLPPDSHTFNITLNNLN